MDFGSVSGICYVVGAVAAVVLIGVGFWQIFKAKEASENDIQVIQRQIKGFAFMILAQVVFALAAAACPLLGGMGMKGRRPDLLRTTVSAANF